MRYVTLLMFSLFLAVITAAWGSEIPAGRDLSEGKALIKSGNYAEAATILRKAVSEAPDDPEANLYLGMALNGLADKEAATYLKRSLLMEPENPATNFEMGMVYYLKNVYAEAADFFENTQLLAPGSDYAQKSQKMLQIMAEKRKGKRWNLSLLTGMQYDSNVIVNGNNNPSPAVSAANRTGAGSLTSRGTTAFTEVTLLILRVATASTRTSIPSSMPLTLRKTCWPSPAPGPFRPRSTLTPTTHSNTCL